MAIRVRIPSRTPNQLTEYDMNTKEEVDKAFNEILDCFGGTDGGISFVKTRTLIEEMQKRSENGDESAAKVVQIVMQFSRLIKIAQTTKVS